MMLIEELWQDVKSFGGFPLSVALIIVFFLLGFKEFAVKLFLSVAVSLGLVILIRLFYFTPRPDGEKFSTPVERIYASSFPSMHSMRASSLATLLFLHFRNPLLGLLFGFLAVLVAIAKVVQKRHYPRDVIVGFLLGIFIALLVNNML